VRVYVHVLVHVRGAVGACVFKGGGVWVGGDSVCVKCVCVCVFICKCVSVCVSVLFENSQRELERQSAFVNVCVCMYAFVRWGG